jgi:hypothetical protein
MQRFTSIPSFSSLPLNNDETDTSYETAIYSYGRKSFLYNNQPIESLDQIGLNYGYKWVSNWKMKGREISDSNFSDVIWRRKKCFCLDTINLETGRRYFPPTEEEEIGIIDSDGEEKGEEGGEEEEDIILLTPFISPAIIQKLSFIQKICFCINL